MTDTYIICDNCKDFTLEDNAKIFCRPYLESILVCPGCFNNLNKKVKIQILAKALKAAKERLQVKDWMIVEEILQGVKL